MSGWVTVSCAGAGTQVLRFPEEGPLVYLGPRIGDPDLGLSGDDTGNLHRRCRAGAVDS